MKNAFSGLHPFVSFVYFVFVLSFSMTLRHPICLIISFTCAAGFVICILGTKELFKRLAFIIPVMFMTAVLNPLFNHEGVTIISYLHDGNPLTLESLIYGGAASLMLGTGLLWFVCFNAVMDSDKIICLFGKAFPSLALIITITLRFIPAYIERMKKTYQLRKSLSPLKGKKFKNLKTAFTAVSSVTSWALESGIETADSMHCRGYGTVKRTSYSIYRFDRRDGILITVILTLGIVLVLSALAGYIDWQYFPMISGNISSMSFFAFADYILLCCIPILIEIQEVTTWRLLKSKN